MRVASSRHMLTKQWKTHDLVASAVRNKIILINLEGSANAKVSLHVKYDVFVNPFPPDGVARRGGSGQAWLCIQISALHSCVANIDVCP